MIPSEIIILAASRVSMDLGRLWQGDQVLSGHRHVGEQESAKKADRQATPEAPSLGARSGVEVVCRHLKQFSPVANKIAGFWRYGWQGRRFKGNIGLVALSIEPPIQHRYRRPLNYAVVANTNVHHCEPHECSYLGQQVLFRTVPNWTTVRGCLKLSMLNVVFQLCSHRAVLRGVGL
jgi:hypothetical protein